VNILQAMVDPKLFRPWFKDPSTWVAWTAFLACLFHLPMDAERIGIARACTGLETLPEQPFTEAWLVVGRRGGKSLVLAMIAIFLALFKDWSANLVPGERGTVLVLAADRRQAQSIMRYATALCTEVPLLAARVERATTEEIEFRGRVGIEVATASYRTVRGRTLIAGLLDEIAFFRSEDSANPDFEILDAIRPAMASMPGSMLLCASSPYSRRGALWEAYRKWYGVADAPCLVWQADTRTMNPTITQKFVDSQYERDPASAMAEYGASFRNDIDSYVTREAIAGVTVAGRRELLPMSGTTYVGFVDPSGGSADSMTLAIAHKEKELAVLDCVREVRPPFSPESVTRDFSIVLKSYRIHRVIGDRYAGEWVTEQFKSNGIGYELAEQAKSDIYRDVLPLINSAKVELLDIAKLEAQFIGLERRTARSGKDSIDHGAGAHDDVVNAACGALLRAGSYRPMKINEDALRRLLSSPPMPGSPNYGRRGPDHGWRVW
jgi:hypothetical protein